jgi:hypothetical protein
MRKQRIVFPFFIFEVLFFQILCYKENERRRGLRPLLYLRFYK